MPQLRPYFYALCLILALAASATAQITNSGLESWSGPALPDNWVGTSEASTLAQSTTANSGTYSALVTSVQTYSGIRQTGLILAPNTKYRISASLRGAGTGAAADVVRIMLVEYLAAGGPNFLVYDTNSQGGMVDAEFRRFSFTFTTAANVAGAELQFGAYQDPSTNPIAFYLDDVSVVAVGVLDNTALENWYGSSILPDAWIPTAEASTIARSSTANAGAYSALVTPGQTYAGIRQTGLVLAPNTKYRLSASLRGAGTGAATDVVRLMIVEYLSAGGPNFLQFATNSQGGLVDAEFRRFSYTFTTNALITGAELHLGAFQDPTTNPIAFYMDDVTLEVVGAFDNAGFENWYGSPIAPDAWVLTAEASSLARVSSPLQSGAYAIQVTPTQTYAGIRQQNIALLPNTTYQVVAWLRGAGTGAATDVVRLLMVEYTGSGPLFHVAGTGDQGGLVDGEYRRCVLKFTTAANVTSGELQIGAFQDPTTNPISFYVDAMTMQSGTAAINPTPAALSFAEGSGYEVDVMLGETSATQQLTIANPGPLDLIVTGISFTGTNGAEFSLAPAPSYPLIVPAAGSAQLPVRFAPPESVRTMGKSATLEIASDANGTPTLSVPITADAVPVELSGFAAE